MTPPANELSQLLADLRTYLQQRQEAGVRWYLDAGPVAATSPLAGPGPAEVAGRHGERSADAPAAGGDDRQEATASASSRSGQPAGRPAGQRPVPAAPARSARAAGKPDEFAQECAAFVRQTLERIAATRRAAVPTQGSIFAQPEEGPHRLDPVGKEAALAELAAEVAPCIKCKLHSGRTQTVFGVGSANADLVFIGEAPGRDEDLQGEPFVGRAGQLLNEILKAIGFRRQDVYICNILKCRPPQNRDPEADETAACEPYLKRQLAILQPKLICCLGRVAAQNLLGTKASLSSLRESVHFYEGIPVMATFHPAALLRNPHWKRPTWEDVRKLRALYDALRR